LGKTTQRIEITTFRCERTVVLETSSDSNVSPVTLDNAGPIDGGTVDSVEPTAGEKGLGEHRIALELVRAVETMALRGGISKPALSNRKLGARLRSLSFRWKNRRNCEEGKEK
jgi:hypothetical protein